MPVAAAATAFITGADGFVGTALIRVLRGLGHPVFALARSSDAAEGLRSAGATPVIGDLLESGSWQDEAAADWVFHVPAYPRWNSRVNSERITSLARTRVTTDARLLDTLTPCASRKIIYVADACCYGRTGPVRSLRTHRRDLMRADQIFSNIRLRGTGFQFEYPTLEQGLQQIVGALHE